MDMQIFGYILSDDFLPYILVGGLLAGLITGLLGAGGGLILVPLFLYILPMIGSQRNVVMHQAISTSLAVMVFSTFSAAYKQYVSKQLPVKTFAKWCPYVLAGTIIGSMIFPYISDHTLKIMFISYLVSVAAYMGLKEENRSSLKSKRKVISFVSNAVSGIFVGALSKLLGIGGATFTVPYYSYYNYDIKSAIALSSAVSLLISTSASIAEVFSIHNISGVAELSQGYVNYGVLILIAPLSIFSAQYGVIINHRISPIIVKWMYILSLLAVSVQLSYDMLSSY